MIEESLSEGLSFLKKNQLQDGNFLSFSSKTLGFGRVEGHNSPFYGALILSCLNNLVVKSVCDEVKKEIATFLLAQKSEYYSFNYWSRNSEEFSKIPYPDDLDVTSCALASLIGSNNKILNGKALAKVVELLTLLEVKEGGPYRTWLVNEDSDAIWKDVDIAVNSNIAYFLSLIDVDLPNLNIFIEKGIKENKLNSPYYYTSLPVIYFISRFYKGKMRENLINLVLDLQKSKSWWGNSMHTALAISSLINLGYKEEGVLKISIKKLIQQQRDGYWKEAPFVIEAKKSKETIYAGSKCLTTAFCLEAISIYSRRESSIRNDKARSLLAKKYQDKIIGKVKNEFEAISPIIGESSTKTIDKILKMNEKNHITGLPYLFYEVFKDSKKKIEPNFLEKCSLANLYGWIAYTIYDDFLDDEGESEMLSIANIALRNMVVIFEGISSKHSSFGPIYKNLMDRIDSSNTWEIVNCRKVGAKLPVFGDNSILADKSIGIALTPVAILFELGFNAKSKEIKLIIEFFNHYLIARQLNDDAHDWEEDLKRKHITMVVAQILKKSKKQPAKKYEEIFWYDVITDICKTINFHLFEAKKCIGANKSIKNKMLLENFLAPIEFAVEKVLTDREKTIEFIDSYGRI